MKLDSDYYPRKHRGGGFAVEVILDDGTEDGEVLATVYGATEDEANTRAKVIIDKLDWRR